MGIKLNPFTGKLTWVPELGGGGSGEFNPQNYQVVVSFDKWFRKRDMLDPPRCNITAAVANGKIYVFAGDDKTNQYQYCDEYDPATDTWARQNNMTNPTRTGATAAAVDERIYVVGGIDSNNNVLPYCDRYTTSGEWAGNWTRVSDIPDPRAWAVSEAVGGKIYVIGGFSLEGPLPYCDEYDPATDTWTRKADMLEPARTNAMSAEVNGKIYVIGGFDINNNILPYCDEYDPTTDTWTRKADMLSNRFYGAAGVINGKIYVIGGISPEGSIPYCDEYDPITDTWTRKAAMLGPIRAGFAAASVGGTIYVIGGDTGATAVPYCDEYTPYLYGKIEEI